MHTDTRLYYVSLLRFRYVGLQYHRGEGLHDPQTPKSCSRCYVCITISIYPESSYLSSYLTCFFLQIYTYVSICRATEIGLELHGLCVRLRFTAL